MIKEVVVEAMDVDVDVYCQRHLGLETKGEVTDLDNVRSWWW